MSKNKSPLIEKAFNDLAQAMGPEVVTELTNVMETAFSFIDTDIDRPQEEKEALKASLVLYFGSSYAGWIDLDHVATEYSPQVAAMVNSALNQPYTDTLAEVKDINVAQMGLVLRCATMQVGADELRLDLDQNPEGAQQMREDIQSMKSNPAVTATPRLLARLEQMTEALIEGVSTPQNSAGIEFGKISVPRTPAGPSEVPPVSVPREPKGPSKPLRGPGIPRQPK